MSTILVGMSQADDQFPIWTPDNVTHPALTEVADAAVAADGSVYVVTKI